MTSISGIERDNDTGMMGTLATTISASGESLLTTLTIEITNGLEQEDADARPLFLDCFLVAEVGPEERSKSYWPGRLDSTVVHYGPSGRTAYGLILDVDGGLIRHQGLFVGNSTSSLYFRDAPVSVFDVH